MIIIFAICICGTLKFVLIDEVIGIMPRLLTGKITRVLESKISRPHFSDNGSPLKILNYFIILFFRQQVEEISNSEVCGERVQATAVRRHFLATISRDTK